MTAPPAADTPATGGMAAHPHAAPAAPARRAAPPRAPACRAQRPPPAGAAEGVAPRRALSLP